MAPLGTPRSSLPIQLVLFYLSLSSALDSLSPSQSLSGPQLLLSKEGKFVLGFFRPGNSSYYYIGIWYSLTMFSVLTPVWVANRETPIADHIRAELGISSNGNLVLTNESNSLIWSTNISATSNSTVAILLDTGNLVLRDGSNASVVLWQSIDHPTNTWLPGGKLGLNKVTGELKRLVAMKSQDDPAPGPYSFGMDKDGSGQFFAVWNDSDRYWSSGLWNGKRFSLFPEMTSNYLYTYEYVSNDQEIYLTYSTKSDNPFISRFVLGASGQLGQLTWLETSNAWSVFWSQPKAHCEVFALCGPFGICKDTLPSCDCVKGFTGKWPHAWGLSDGTSVCARSTPLQCHDKSSNHSERDRFYPLFNVRLPDNAHSSTVASDSDCELYCLNNCSCSAYSYGADGCLVWYGDLLNLQDQYNGSGGGTVFLRLAASEFVDSKTNKREIIAPVIGSLLGSLALLVIMLLVVKKKMRKGRMTGEPKEDCGLVAFRYSDLKQITKNFSEKLGEGGFGTVFKGVLPDSTGVAVKKLEGIKQGEKQFWSEVRTIGTTQHVNLVRLHGFCSEGIKKLLVYEYMPNGSLDSYLFRNDSGKFLDWRTRYQIAVGIAQGLAYLHDHCRDCIIHCDIKPENILLDASFVPKVADFGLAKLLGRDYSRILTTMRGTIGYLAPEWISGMAITPKADVYSYGMMLFEIISGKRNLIVTEDENAAFFPALAARELIEGDVLGLLDPKIGSDAELEEVLRACKVACWCIQDHVNSRPTMRQIVQILEATTEVDTPPIPKILQILADHSGSIISFSELSSKHNSQMEVPSSAFGLEHNLGM